VQGVEKVGELHRTHQKTLTDKAQPPGGFPFPAAAIYRRAIPALAPRWVKNQMQVTTCTASRMAKAAR